MSTFSDSTDQFDIQSTFSFPLHYHDHIEIFMGRDRNVRSDLIFSHIDVVSSIYVEDGIHQKDFLPTKISNFHDILKTSVVAVYRSCSSPTPIKINHRRIFNDTFRFYSRDYHDIFPSVEFGDFLQETHRKTRHLSWPTGWSVLYWLPDDKCTLVSSSLRRCENHRGSCLQQRCHQVSGSSLLHLRLMGSLECKGSVRLAPFLDSR